MLDGQPAEGSPPSSILVLGGASAVGANAIQLLRVAYPSLPILATASPKHHEHMYSLGASKVVDYRSQSIVAELKEASPEGAGVDVIIDRVSAGASQTDFCDIINPAFSRRYACVRTGADVSVPSNAKPILTSAEFTQDGPGGHKIIPALAKPVEDGVYRLPLLVRAVGQGLATLPGVLNQVKRASSDKLVLTL